MGLFTPYIRKEWKNNIINYKFQSTDSSILYNYITSPLCNYLVKFVPEDFAPNMITVCGMLCVILINILCNFYGGLDGKGNIPGWISILSGILYFSYHLLDLMDGKHARNTKNSSALGLLMDHGCDALTTFLFLMSFANIIKLEGAVNYAIIWLIAGMTFFFCTLEEYHLDRLDFPSINGINEGALLASLILIFTGILPENYWLQTTKIIGFYFKYNQLLVYSFFIFSFLYTVASIIKMSCASHVKIKDIIFDSLMYIYLVLSMFLVIFFSNASYVNEYPKLLLYNFGFLFAKLVGLLQLAHLSKAIFTQFRKSLIISTFSPAALSLINYKLDIFEMNSLIVVFLIYSFFVWLHFVYCISEELCELLNIYRFSIKKGLKKVMIA